MISVLVCSVHKQEELEMERSLRGGAHLWAVML